MDERQLKSQGKLQNAYLQLIANGVEKLSIQQICQVAGITRPTFYKQYEDIGQLRLALHDRLMTVLLTAITVQNPKPMDHLQEEELSFHVRALFEHIQFHRQAYETLLIDVPDALFIRRVKEVIWTFIEQGMQASGKRNQLREENEAFLISFYVGAYMESILWWMKNDYVPEAKTMAKSVVETGLKGSFKDLK